MFDILTEAFILEYFLYQAILGKYFNSKEIFKMLESIFDIKNNHLYDLLESDVIKDIQTEEDYKRYQRIKQYNEFLPDTEFLNQEEEDIIALKGKAFKISNEQSLFSKSDMTHSLIERNIYNYARRGSVLAMRILGTLQCQGIFFKKDLKSGKKYLKKASQWTDVAAALCLIEVDEENRASTISMLKAAIEDAPYQFLSDEVQKRYGLCVHEISEEVQLLKKVFASGKINPDIYQPLYARLIFSTTMDLKDKKKIVFSENKEMLSSACDLPLNISKENVKIDEDLFHLMPIIRERELHQLTISLKNSDLRNLNSYKPICLVSDSDFALEFYIKSLKDVLGQNHIERIHISDLNEQDFESTINHVFLRHLKENKNNVYILEFKGEIQQTILDKIKNFLKSENRTKFHLNLPAVHLDLSGILPICICDEENASKIKAYVEMIEIESINHSEKPAVIKALIDEKSKTYKMDNLKLDENAFNELNRLSLDNIDQILDQAFKEYRSSADGLITKEMLLPYLEDKKTMRTKSSYGFGGFIYENH